MFLWKALQQIFISGLVAFGSLLALFAAGFFLPSVVWITALRPGMLLAENLFSVTPTIFEWLAGDAEDAPLTFAAASVILSFLFWWLCALVLLQAVRFRRSKRALR